MFHNPIPLDNKVNIVNIVPHGTYKLSIIFTFDAYIFYACAPHLICEISDEYETCTLMSVK